MLDAVRHIKNLEATGFNREQAEAQVQVVYETLGENVASKEDIAQVKSEMTKEFTAIRSEMATKNELAALKSEMATKRDLVELKVEILYKMGALFVSSMTVATAIIGILIKF